MKNYNNIAKSLKKYMSKTNIMAFILGLIISDAKIKQNQYMIIASYCLKEYRSCGDLDVVITINGYEKLKKLECGTICKAKISGNKRIIIKLSALGNNTEIEFFPKKFGEGFPSKYFSIKNLRENNKLLIDDFGNPYYNIKTCIEQYSLIKKNNNEYYLGDFKVNKERVIKNIGHLNIIKNKMKGRVPKYLLSSIKYLESIL
jgi:hypothetical protein